jgi:hypothetical protein
MRASNPRSADGHFAVFADRSKRRVDYRVPFAEEKP